MKREGGVLLCVLFVFLVPGCERAPAGRSASGEVQPVETSSAPMNSPNPRFAESVEHYESSGMIVWADGFEGELIAGLDGSQYLPYSGRAVEGVQDLLRTRGLYSGPVNGVLDPPTMQAIADFQDATHTLGVTGIPTPRTREMLRQGSHTI